MADPKLVARFPFILPSLWKAIVGFIDTNVFFFEIHLNMQTFKVDFRNKVATGCFINDYQAQHLNQSAYSSQSTLEVKQ